MTKEALTEEITIDALRKFFREKPFLFFGTGMSCALDVRFGMDALKDALIDQRLKNPRISGSSVSRKVPVYSTNSILTGCIFQGKSFGTLPNLRNTYSEVSQGYIFIRRIAYSRKSSCRGYT